MKHSAVSVPLWPFHQFNSSNAIHAHLCDLNFHCSCIDPFKLMLLQETLTKYIMYIWFCIYAHASADNICFDAKAFAVNKTHMVHQSPSSCHLNLYSGSVHVFGVHLIIETVHFTLCVFYLFHSRWFRSLSLSICEMHHSLVQFVWKINKCDRKLNRKSLNKFFIRNNFMCWFGSNSDSLSVSQIHVYVYSVLLEKCMKSDSMVVFLMNLRAIFSTNNQTKCVHM